METAQIHFGHNYTIRQEDKLKKENYLAQAREMLGNSSDEYYEKVRKNQPYIVSDVKVQDLYGEFSQELDQFKNEDSFVREQEKLFDTELKVKKAYLARLQNEIKEMEANRNNTISERVSTALAEKAKALATNIGAMIGNHIK